MTRWKCRECYWIGTTDAWFSAPSPFASGATMTGCPACFEVNSAERICDEPNCDALTSCGFPTQGGYRNTCHAHSDHGRSIQ